MVSMSSRIRKVKVLEGTVKASALKLGLSPEDLVLVTSNGIEKVVGDPVSFLLKRAMVDKKSDV